MTAFQQPNMGRVYFFLVLNTIFWGGSFLFSKIGLREVPPHIFVLTRFFIASLIMLAISAPRLRMLDRGTIRRGIIVGVAVGVTNLSFVFGIQGTSISRAGVLNNLFVLFIPVITKIFWRDRIGGANIFGIVLAVFGIWFLASGGGGFNRGDLISTICAMFIALHIISVSKVLKVDDDVYLVSCIQFITVMIMAGISTLFLPIPHFSFTPTAIWTIAYCALFPTVLCFTLQNTYQRFVTPTQAGLIYTLDPVWSLLAGFLFLDERLLFMEWFGCGLIFFAALLPLLLRFQEERSRVKRCLLDHHDERVLK